MAVTQAHLPTRLLKIGKIFGVIVIVYCIYLTADRFWMHFLPREPRTSPETQNLYSRTNDNVPRTYSNPLGIKTKSAQNTTIRFETPQCDLKPCMCEYLSPCNILRNISASSGQNKAMHNFLAKMFRTGIGLMPFKTEDGQNAWMENGVIFRPIRRDLNLMSNRDDIKPLHPSDFEYYVPFDEDKFFQGSKRPSGEPATPKIILWRQPLRYIGYIPNPRPMRLCPDFPCQITTNKLYEVNSSAMIFEGSLISYDVPKRNPDQVFIFHHTETPLSDGYLKNRWLSKSRWRSAFNWTMSFRLDSDIPSPYGLIRKRTEPLEKNYTELVAAKTKLVASIISHCDTKSKRELYIKKLKEFIRVDIFGKCGTKCMRGDSRCDEHIASNYKFYLAFENTMCEDYVTEKFFRYISYDYIIIARGGVGYFKHAPPEIFINTADYKSPQELANHLLYLDNHPKKYEAMLREKNKYVGLFEAYYRVSKGHIEFVHHHYEAVPLCRVCHWLWMLDSHRKTIPDIKAWMMNISCIEPTDMLDT